MLSRQFIRKVYQNTRYYFATSKDQFDLAIIGGGPGGYVAAIKASQLGLKTACVEKRGSLGGTCLNVGCIPSKALLNISHKYEDSKKHFKDLGIEIEGNLTLNFNQMMKKKTDVVTGLTRGIEGLFAKNKVEYVKGYGSFIDQNNIKCDLLDGNTRNISAKNIIVATGSEPAAFPGIPFDEEIFVSSTGALALKQIPKKLIVIGAGYIGLEMGSVYARLGTEVTVVEYADRVVPALDIEIASQFQKMLQKQGLKIHLKTKVISGKKNNGQAEITIEPKEGGKSETLTADVCLIATGRRPFTDKLNAQEIGVQIDKYGKIAINEIFQTSVSNIYAIGDVVSGPMLAHKAEEEGVACVEILSGHDAHINYNTIPGVIYTHPEVAAVGRTEEQLKEEGIQYKKGVFPFMANSRARANADSDGLVKILSDSQTNKILGIHIIGPNAGEMIAEGVLGMEYGATPEDIGRVCHAHPTLSEAFKEACLAAHSKPIHF